MPSTGHESKILKADSETAMEETKVRGEQGSCGTNSIGQKGLTCAGSQETAQQELIQGANQELLESSK